MSRHLMARFRHLHAADGDGFDLDWESLAPYVGHRAQLENGDHAFAFPVGTNGQWGYVLFGPKTRHEQDPNVPDGERSYQRFTGDTEHVYSEVLGGSGTSLRPDMESAMRDAEEHYFGLGRRGQAPASGLDYEKLVNPSQELDDDYGDIFGGGK